MRQERKPVFLEKNNLDENGDKKKMLYNEYPYNIFNQNSIAEYIRQQQHMQEIQQYHEEQKKNIMDMRKAIADYCKAARKVSPEYQPVATEQCLQEIMTQADMDGNRH